jgi:hypothetical protein
MTEEKEEDLRKFTLDSRGKKLTSSRKSIIYYL